MTGWNRISDAGFDALGWMLLHFGWQGFAVAAVLAITLAVFKAPRQRYAAASIALLVMFTMALFTFVSLNVETRLLAAQTIPGAVEVHLERKAPKPIIYKDLSTRPPGLESEPQEV